MDADDLRNYLEFYQDLGVKDLYRQAAAAGGALKLAGVQKRVETMLTMTGAQNFIEVHPDEPSAVKSFGA